MAILSTYSKRMVMRGTLLFFLFAIAIFPLEAQNVKGDYLWQEKKSQARTTESLKENGLIVSKFKVFQLNANQLTQSLSAINQNESSRNNLTVLPFPTSSGALEQFKIQPSNTLHPDLAKKFPAIQTYEGVGIDNPNAIIRFEISPKGISGMIWSTGKSTQVIQVLNSDYQKDKYIVFNKKSAQRSKDAHFDCHTDHIEQPNRLKGASSGGRYNDGFLRTYRLALAGTAEYTSKFGGTKAGALAAMATTINRVNGILKRDVAIELQLVANNDQIVFTDGASDGYSNNDSGAMLDENQSTLDSIIGNNGYDIGHVFSTGNGGVAVLGSICVNTFKAQGVTGSPLPQGDAFDVDYVTHELGHQLGANHTQNNDCQSFIGTSFEPGSGSTIMGYAGICAPNIQSNSDDYFHSISIDQIKGKTAVTGASDCSQKVVTGNTRPVVNAGVDFTIPHSTPFELAGTASDADNHALTYCWEQMNNETAAMPPVATATQGPSFRSLPPIDSPIRQFPAIDAGNNHTSSTWEVLPSVGRNMKFRLTVRDNFNGGGNTTADEMDLTVDSNSGPFVVSAPNGGESLPAGIGHTVTWDVAGTNVAPINCQNVTLYLSTDGGQTYPIVLAEDVPNNGSTTVTFQSSMITTNARLKIKGSNNVFFDVSNANFEIRAGAAGFDLTIGTSSQTICQGSSPVITVNVVSVDNFSGTVDLSATVPAAFTGHSFASSSVSTGASTSLTINTDSNMPPGNYQISIVGISGTIEIIKPINFTVLPNSPAVVTLGEPATNATEVATVPTFDWTDSGTGNTYTIEIAESTDFSNPTYAANNLQETSHILPISLGTGQTYFWRVRANNECGPGSFATPQSFTITNNLCQTLTNDNAMTISSGDPSTVVSEIVISETGQVSSVQVGIDISHSWVEDLTVVLESPSGQTATLLSEVCGNKDQFIMTFGNGGLVNIPCNPPISQELIAPMETFAIFDNEPANGTWKLKVSDGIKLDGGTLNSWTLAVCRVVENNEPLSVLINNTTNPNCNGGSTGSIQASINGGEPNYTIAWSHGANQLTLNDLAAGTYGVTVTDGNGATATASATLSEPPALALDDIVENVNCHDTNTGSIKVYPSGGTPGYIYQWANGVQQFDNLNLPSGNYGVTVTDANGCAISKQYTITQPSPLELSFASNNAVDGQNGSLDLSVLGGTGGYNYVWSSGATTRDVDGLAPGNFTVTVTDANGCSTMGEANIITETTGPDCYNVTVNITLDNYGSENNWEIRDANGTLVQEVGPFNNFENGAVKATSICLPPGCYDFTIFDLWGDGMCCAYGNGGYTVIDDATGTVLASGGSFNKEETKNICLPLGGTNGDAIIDYCGANGRNTQYEWIETVEISGLVFNSGDDGGYGDYTATPIDVAIGGTLDLAFTPGFGFFEYHENYQVWIDFNGDGDFDDEGEAAFLTSGNERVTGIIGVPSAATAGATRMRIAMKWGELVTPCESFSWGEVEDYTLNLTPPANHGERNGAPTISKIFKTGQPLTYTHQERFGVVELELFPNPATENISVSWEDQRPHTYELTIFNPLGQVVEQQKLESTSGTNKLRLTTNSFTNGVYRLQLRDGKRLINKDFVIMQ